MKSSKNISLLFFLFILLYSSQITACDLKLHGLNDIHISFNKAYSHKNENGQIVVEHFSVKSSESNCKFFVTFTNSNNNELINMYGQALNYEIYDSIQYKYKLSGEHKSTNNVLSGRLVNNQPISSLKYYLHVPYNLNATAGVYSNSIDISLYEETSSEHILRDTQRVNYYVVIPTDISVSIQSMFSVGSQSNLDFSTLQIGESRSFSVDVTSNIPYDISIESENKGYLKHEKNGSYIEIPYMLLKNGQIINLSQLTTLSNTGNTFQYDVIKYEFNVTIKEFDFVLSGKYQDNITFTVIAK